MRLLALCAGECLSFVRDVCRLVGKQLLFDIPTSLSAAERDAIMADFYNGQAHLLYEPPFLLPTSAHHDKHIARNALKRCFGSSSTHPLILELQAAPLRDEAEMHLSGFMSLRNVPHC